MEQLRKTNAFMEKWIYVIMPVIMLLGLTSGKGLSAWTGWTSVLFMILTFISSMQADYRKFVVLIKKPVLLGLFMAAAHLIIPWTIFRISGMIFPAHPDLVTGITLSTLLPLGVTSIFWVAYNQASVETTVSLVTMDTLLSPFIVPLTLSVVMGSHVSLNAESLTMNLLKLVLIPTLLGMLFGEYLKKRTEKPWLRPTSSLAGKVCLYIIVLLNAASISEQLDAIGSHVVLLVAVIFFTMIFGYVVNFFIASLFTRDRRERVAISYSGGVRNYTVGVVLATAFFKPVVALPVLIAMLLQHPMALLFFYVFRWTNHGAKLRKELRA